RGQRRLWQYLDTAPASRFTSGQSALTDRKHLKRAHNRLAGCASQSAAAEVYWLQFSQRKEVITVFSDMLTYLRRWAARRQQDKRGISLNREDTERLDQFTRSVRRVRISRSLLGLAWTAGPVTALGLYGGY